MVVTAERAPDEHPPSIDIASSPRMSKPELKNMYEILGGKFIHDAMEMARHPGYLDMGMGVKYQLSVDGVLDAVKETDVSLADASAGRMTDPRRMREVETAIPHGTQQLMDATHGTPEPPYVEEHPPVRLAARETTRGYQLLQHDPPPTSCGVNGACSTTGRAR